MGGGSSSGDNMSNLWNQGSSYQPPPDYSSLWTGLSRGIGQGAQIYGKSVPSSLPPAAGSDQIRQPFSIQGQANQGYPLIPTNASQSGDQMQQIMQIIQQLLGSGGQM